jgi:hypothetical protein
MCIRLPNSLLDAPRRDNVPYDTFEFFGWLYFFSTILSHENLDGFLRRLLYFVRISRAGCEPATRLCSKPAASGPMALWTFRWSKGRPKSAICVRLLASRYDGIDLSIEYNKHHGPKCILYISFVLNTRASRIRGTADGRKYARARVACVKAAGGNTRRSGLLVLLMVLWMPTSNRTSTGRNNPNEQTPHLPPTPTSGDDRHGV